jgi:pyruvate dehydrogenase E2 component (dihydrolipoamide acetyltransferase)
MAHPIIMPKLGQMTEESTIVRWLKQEGEAVAKGDILLEIETDKAVMEVESFFEGTLLKILAPEGRSVEVMTTVGFIGNPGEELPEAVIPERPKPGELEAPVPAAPTRPAEPAETVPASAPGPAAAETVPAAPFPPAGRLRISPRAARFARQNLLDPSGVQGTGPGGRIVEKDVKAFLQSHRLQDIPITPAARELAAREKIDLLTLRTLVPSGPIEEEDVRRALEERPRELSRMRQIIAQRLTRSYTTVPHFFVTVSADMSCLEAQRADLKRKGHSFSVSDFLVKAAASALADHPDVNSTTDGHKVRWHSGIHIGLAVALEQGLVVPVIRHADRLSLADIHEKAAELVARAREGRLTPDEMTGSTFTISNMGMLDVENFTAIINPGESAILAVSSSRLQAVVLEGKVVVRPAMKMTLSADHRLVDGALAARFVNAIKRRLEEETEWI